jgi:hypothetical protein
MNKGGKLMAVVKVETRVSGKWTIDRLKLLSISEIEKLYRTLPAPSIEEMRGEYRGGYIGCDQFISNQIWKLSAWNPLMGFWQGKAFEPLSRTEGRGFNITKKFGRTIRKWPMRTTMSASFIDGNDVFLLDYPFYASMAGFAKMTDEIRKIDVNLFLGIGHWKLGVPLTSVWFTLAGPIKPFDPGDLVFKKRVTYKA